MVDTNNNSENESSEQTQTGGTRRKFLKQASAVGGALTASSLGVSKVRASPTKRANRDDLQTALDDPKVQSLLEALGSPKVLAQRGAVQTKSVDDITVDVTVVPTTVGDIKYGVRGDGGTEAQFRFESVRAQGQLPKKYRSLPTESAILKGLGNDVVLARNASEDEKSAIVEDLAIEADTVVAFTTSERESFTVKYLGSDDTLYTYAVGSAKTYTESDVTEFSYEQVSASSSRADSPSTTDIDDCNEDWCWRCLMSTGACGGCIMACSAVGPGCALCLVSTCGASGYSCTACIDCNT